MKGLYKAAAVPLFHFKFEPIWTPEKALQSELSGVLFELYLENCLTRLFSWTGCGAFSLA